MISIKNKKNLETIINEMRNLALSYLEKYSPTKQQLRTYLLKKFMNQHGQIRNKNELLDLIDASIINLEKQKFVSDKLYSDSKAKIYLKRGYSLNKIRYNLIKKGISDEYIKGSISKIKNQESDPDFFSAIILCKKRRIGAVREENNRTLFYKKDMGILARSGFSYETSKRVLNLPKEEFKKFTKLL